VTAAARTLLDLAARLRQRDLSTLLERTERLGLLDLIQIDSLLSRCGGHNGAERLRKALKLYRDPAFTRSWSERKFLELVKKAGLPKPAMNFWIAGHEVDAYWERQKFAVELDSYQYHGTRAAFERDPLRHESLKLAGIDSIRFTARRIEREPDEVAARLKTLLAQRQRALEARS
jgi:very-short-patch-repair endonuclease